MTDAITGHDDDPNSGSAPAILQGSPVGTWFREETAGVWWRKIGTGATDWEIQRDGYDTYFVVEDGYARDAIPSENRSLGMQVYVRNASISFTLTSGISNSDWISIKKQSTLDPFDLYVNPGGNDLGDGTITDPIKTLKEAKNRLPLSGNDVTLHLSAGSFPRPDNTASTAGSRTSFGVLDSQLVIQGTTSVYETFTVDSNTSNIITATGSPGWSTNEHTGRFATINAIDYPIISNTSNTVTVVYLPNTDGGYLVPPAPATTVDITTRDSAITDPLTGSIRSFKSRIDLFGQVALRDVKFFTTSFGAVVAGAFNAKIQANGCVFESSAGPGIFGAGPSSSMANCIFIGCSTAIDAAARSWNISSCGFVSCTFGIVCSGIAFLSFAKFGIICARSVATLFRPRQGGVINDGSFRCHLESVTRYVLVGKGGIFFRDGQELTAIPGFGSPSYVVSVEGAFGSVDVDLWDTTISNLTPTTALIDFGGVDVSLATYEENGKSISDDKGNHVYG